VGGQGGQQGLEQGQENMDAGSQVHRLLVLGWTETRS
jgi:hypothetical protein